jgi:cadherin 5 type 2 (VE-cadherin)
MCCRYRTEDNDQWLKLSSVSEHEAVVEDMTPGEKYRIQVNTVSYGVESNQPQEVTQTVSEYIALCSGDILI